MKLGLLFIALLPLGADTISVQQISFTNSVFGKASASEGPLGSDPIVSASISVDAYSNNQGTVYASASMSFTDQITITGGSGTGIAVLCSETSFYQMRDQWHGYPDLNIAAGLSGLPESGDYSEECPANSVPGAKSLETTAAQFIYGIPFDLGVTITADASAVSGGGNLPCYGCADEESLSAESQFFIVDPPAPPSVPEPATLGMSGIGVIVLLLHRCHLNRPGHFHAR